MLDTDLAFFLGSVVAVHPQQRWMDGVSSADGHGVSGALFLHVIIVLFVELVP